jgi:hypothetical protein
MLPAISLVSVLLGFLLLPSTLAQPATSSLGSILNISCSTTTSICNINSFVAPSTTTTVPLRLVFHTPTIIQWWLALDGNFSDVGAAADVIVGISIPINLLLTDKGTFYEISQTPSSSSTPTVQIEKSTSLFSIYLNNTLVVSESSPLTWNSTSSWQTLTRDTAPFPSGLSEEHFFGGGMQNGFFAHRDNIIQIGVGEMMGG